jgi:hypothetical protein
MKRDEGQGSNLKWQGARKTIKESDKGRGSSGEGAKKYKTSQ